MTKPGEKSEPAARRSREGTLRDIKLALAIDGLSLNEQRSQGRGFDPYDSGMNAQSRDVWGRRRG